MTHGGTTLTLSGVSVIRANALLGASYQLYRHVETNETIIRTVGYALPAALHGLVQTVAPTTCFTFPRRQRQPPCKRSSGAAAGPASGEPVTVLSSRDDDDATPSFLRSLYKTAEYTPTATDRNRLGVLGIMGDYPSPEDLAMFMYIYRSDGVDATLTVEQVNGGGYDPSNPHPEANLDTQYAEAMVYPTPVIFYSTGRGPSGRTESFLSWFSYILNQPTWNIPPTISSSYMGDEKSTSREYSVYLCTLFSILAGRGISMLFASGDDGVGAGDCLTSDGSVQFIPKFPSTCTCGVFSRLWSSTQAQVRVTHHAAMLLQVPGSLPSAERRATCQSSRQNSPGAASRTTLKPPITRNGPCPSSSSTSALSIKASTSAFASIT